MADAPAIAGLEEVAAIAAEHAARVDADAAFPEAALEDARRRGLLGQVSAKEVGGRGGGMRDAVEVVARLARECGSAAMVVSMHYASVPVVEKLGDAATRRRVAAGELLLTLAFSETGSRSHFWAPLSTARRDGRDFVLDAQKSFVTAANRAHAYVWSSKPVEAKGESTLWLVPRTASGLARPDRFEGLGLRGNDSAPVTAAGVRVRESDRLGADGGGFATMMEVVLPWFNLVNAACSVGLMEALVTRSAAHAAATRHTHLDQSLAGLPTIRAYLARMRIDADLARTLLGDALVALETGRADAMLRVLEVKAAAGELATAVGDLAMRVCGGAAFKKEVGVERFFRDARAATVMGPTTDVLYDFIGKALTGQSLF
jgi:alkylation response protein AidB-like acyl-CoA dehydrogenase